MALVILVSLVQILGVSFNIAVAFQDSFSLTTRLIAVLAIVFQLFVNWQVWHKD